MTRLARLSLTHRALVVLVAVVLTGFGLYAIPKLKQQLLPSLEFPVASVVAQYPGAGPDVVDQQVTQPLEQAIRSVPGVTGVRSTSSDGSSAIQTEFDYGTKIDDATGKIQRAIDRIGSTLPQGVKPAVLAGSTDNLPAVVLAASADLDQRQLAERLKNTVVPKLREISGVQDATVTGARDQSVTITPNIAAIVQLGLKPDAITAALKGAGTPIPAGQVGQDGRSLTVQVGGRIGSIDELRALSLATPTGGAVPLSQIATVEQTAAPATSITRTNGKESLGVSITVGPDGNAVEVSKAVTDKLDDLAKELGKNGKLTAVFDQAPFVQKSISGLTTEGLLGLLFAVLVILLFLFSVRSTVVTAVSIPLSVVIALIVLWAGDYSLNLLTLGGLTIAVGRVVDDSIVVLENIKRHIDRGEDRLEAVLSGVREVTGAVVASTLTTVAVFLPIAVVGGLVGELFAPFAVTVTVALLASLLVALTIIPVLSYWFLKPSKDGHQEDEDTALERAYAPVITFATGRRKTTIAIALVTLFITLGLTPLLKTNFISQSGQNVMQLTQIMPIGSSLGQTDKAAEPVEKILGESSEVKSYQVTVGAGANPFGGGGGNANRANYAITLNEDQDAEEFTPTLKDRLAKLDEKTIGKVSIGGGDAGGFNSDGVQVSVKAQDQKSLDAAAEQVRKAVAETPDTSEVTSDIAKSVPRVQVSLDRAKAGPLGLTDQTVGQLVAGAFKGAPVTQIASDGGTLDVVLRNGTTPTTVDELRGVPITTPAGAVRLADIATVSIVDGPVQIKRTDGVLTATVSAKASAADIGKTTTEMTNRLKDLKLPTGASYELGGVSQQQADAFSDLGMALLVAIAVVFIIMVATFKSLIQPLILLVSIPFAATGALVLLLITGTPLGVPALIGMLMLVGIVVTNAIVLIDLINQYREQGMDVATAVAEGGKRRLRPILMTAAATICALVPMSLGLTGGGGFISQPLAVVVIGGLLSSTVLTLIVVPTLYTIVEGRKERRAARQAGDS
ncbi:efflux RND transporter permease subunit [Pseudonocardiaceae bacterium YIM PH 21723]|nr:efflux RND transporter permease subunit [Pseudonocardiaceae bacterium YIM PH 21723]